MLVRQISGNSILHEKPDCDIPVTMVWQNHSSNKIGRFYLSNETKFIL